MSIEIKLPARFHNRVLPITGQIAEVWGGIAAQAQTKGIRRH
jgi:predicted nucleic acid-binding protein